MENKIPLILFLCCCISQEGAASCENGWTALNDQTCIKSFPSFLTYPEAKMFCTTQGNSTSPASLVMIKDAATQEFVANYTNNSFDNFWLGGKYNDDTTQFEWEDGEPLAYTNWGDGYPRPNPSTDVCIQLRAIKGKTTNSLDGKWEDAACQRRNLALCQRAAVWSLEDAVRELLKMRRELEETKQELADFKQDLTAMVVPVGSIYIEYSDQPSPVALWPNFGWQDITNAYSGLFFRALGGDSESWGKSQGECAPRIREAWFTVDGSASGNAVVDFPTSGWSEPLNAGWFHRYQTDYGNEMIRFDIQGCEVRPKNQAIRIWKRTN